MCGLAGIVDLGPEKFSTTERLEAMAQTLAHRGPDGSGVQNTPEIGFAHRRLSIIDLSSLGAQPMSYAGRYTIVFNGEIYNYIELRQELQNLGYSFQTQSDTEVLLAALACFGVGALPKLDGMFTFAFWDAKTKKLLCARDRFGEKPFFYAMHHGSFVFASEIKALRACGVPLSVDDEMLFLFLQHEVVQSLQRPSASFYRGVQTLRPAHWMEIDVHNGRVGQQVQYWDLPREPTTLGRQDRQDQFLELLTRSVSRRLRSDVSVGTSLSGGLDSSAIVALMTRIQPQSRTSGFSARFDDPALDEGGQMSLIRDVTGVDWKQVWPAAQGLADELDCLFAHHEEPVLGTSVYAQWCVMRLAAESGTKVLIDGQGADEFLAGYHHFFRPYLSGLLRSSPKNYLRNRSLVAATAPQVASEASSLQFALRTFFPDVFVLGGGLRRRIGSPQKLAWINSKWAHDLAHQRPPFRSHVDLDAALRFFTAEYGLRTLLRYADRSSMAFGVEVRLPFLDHRLVEFVFSCPEEDKILDGATKQVLRMSMDGIVPDAIRLRKDKLGFQPPEDRWLANPSIQERAAESFQSLKARGIVTAEAQVSNPQVAWKMLMAESTFRFASGQI